MDADIPLDLIRSFVAVADSGTVTRAADRVGRTQPAVSLQLRRLQDLVGRALLDRDGRTLTLTPAGELFLAHARRLLDAHADLVAAVRAEPVAGPVRIGVVQDVADTLLPGALARFARIHPRAVLDVRVAGSRVLEDAMAHGHLDVAVSVGAAGTEGERAVAMAWLGDPALAARPTLPLALLDPPCRFRDAALTALEAAGRPWRIAVTTPSLSGLSAAVRGGLGLTCRTAAFVGDGIAALGPDAGLPPLPRVAYRVAADPSNPAAAALATLVGQALDDHAGDADAIAP